MTNKGQIHGALILIGLIIIVVGVLIWYGVHSNNKMEDNDCLRNIVEDFCEGEGLFYSSIYWDFFHSGFYCKENVRRLDGKKNYVFLEEELERCLG